MENFELYMIPGQPALTKSSWSTNKLFYTPTNLIRAILHTMACKMLSQQAPYHVLCRYNMCPRIHTILTHAANCEHGCLKEPYCKITVDTIYHYLQCNSLNCGPCNYLNGSIYYNLSEVNYAKRRLAEQFGMSQSNVAYLYGFVRIKTPYLKNNRSKEWKYYLMSQNHLQNTVLTNPTDRRKLAASLANIIRSMICLMISEQDAPFELECHAYGCEVIKKELKHLRHCSSTKHYSTPLNVCTLITHWTACHSKSCPLCKLTIPTTREAISTVNCLRMYAIQFTGLKLEPTNFLITITRNYE